MNRYKAFREFLDNRGYAKEFDHAFRKAYPGYHLNSHLWAILGGDECFLGRAFDWEQTPQGRNYWAGIDKEWYNLYIHNLA